MHEKIMVDHYAGMVGLHGHAGKLDDACNIIIGMPVQPDAGVFGAALGACRIHWNVERGEGATEHLFYLEPENVGY
jgi:hypothetical protein